MRHFKSKSFHLSWMVSILAAGAALFYIEKNYMPVSVDVPQIGHELHPTTTPTPAAGQATPTPAPTPAFAKTFSLKIPFSSQAPTANWDELHNEACEETSAIMVAEYFSGNTAATLAPELVESELSKITEWEKNTFGYYLDIDASETARLLNNIYGLKTQLVKNMTEEEIKTELKAGHAVIWSANGRKLGNPNFRQPGPPYHMLVIKGWDSTGFITNDPGTRKGRNYPYTYQTLYNAAGAWSHNLNAVDEGDKTAIIVWKETTDVR